MPFNRASRDITARRHAMQEAADKAIAAIEAGTVPWRREWHAEKCAGPQGPVNGATNHRYSGINVVVLACCPRAFIAADPRWCSYQQASERGWQVRKGERASTVFFTKQFSVAEPDAKEHEDTESAFDTAIRSG